MIRSTISGLLAERQGHHERGPTDSLGILVSLTLGRSTRILAIVGKFVGVTVGSDGIGIDDGSTTTSDHGPDAALSVEDSKFEGGTSGAIELLDVRFLLGQVTTERRRPDLRQTAR